MDCPICKTTPLTMAERQGIEIDYCPQCRGVWLDRGELDKIIDRSIGATPAEPAAAPAPAYRPQESVRAQRDYDPRHNEHYYKKKKRSGFLSEIFDFD